MIGLLFLLLFRRSGNDDYDFALWFVFLIPCSYVGQRASLVLLELLRDLTSNRTFPVTSKEFCKLLQCLYKPVW